jgi:hypothetical protein
MTYQLGPMITHNQQQILYGTILGGSSIIRPDRGKNCYLAMRDRDRNWLMYKTEELASFFKMDQYIIKKDKNTYRCYSIAYPIFNEVYEIFYKDGVKILTREILEGLNDVAWMVWFVDAGRKSKRKAYLRTHKFGDEGTQIICDYFNSLNCDCSSHLCRGRHEIVFSNKGAFELLHTMVNRMPRFIMERLDEGEEATP